MKRIFSSIFLLLVFGFLFLSNAKAGEREDNFVNLAMSGDVDGVRSLLDQGVDVNAKDSHGNTALTGAIMSYHQVPDRNYMEVVQLLLARGADINEIGRLGYTPLISAEIGGEADIVRILIDKGANVNKKGHSGGTALMDANEKLEKGRMTGFDASFNPIYAPLTPTERETYTNIVRMLQAAGAK